MNTEQKDRPFVLNKHDIEKNIFEVGNYILPEFWGKGLGTEALKRVVEYAISDLKVSNISAGHNPKNEASKKVLTKVGFNYIGDEYYEPTGLMHPSYLFYKKLN